MALHRLQHVHFLHCSTVSHPEMFLSGAKIEYYTERMDPGLSFREKLEVKNHLSMDFFISYYVFVLSLVLLVELKDFRSSVR